MSVGQGFYPPLGSTAPPPTLTALPASVAVPPPNSTPAAPVAVATPPPTAVVASAAPTTSPADQAYLDAAKTFQAQKPPEYDAPKYKPPTKLEEAIPAILGLLFPGSKIATAASGFASGVQQGAERRYDRATQDADKKYSAAENKYNDARANVHDLGQVADAQDRIREQADAAAQRATEAAENRQVALEREADRHKEATTRLQQYARGLDEKADQIGINKDRLKVDTWRYGQQIDVAQQRNAITEEDANRAASLRYKLGMLMETGRDARYSTSVQVSQARTKAATINAGLTNGIKGILAGTDTPEVQQQKIGQLISQANDAVSGLYAGISSQHPELAQAEDFDSVDSGETVNGEPMSGDYRTGNSTVDVMREAEAERLREGGGGAPVGTPGGTGTPSGDYAWENQPMRGAGGAPPAGAGVHVTTAPPKPALPNGPGAAPDDFKQFTTLVSQHAKDYQTPQALLAAMSASPTYASLSAAQANQLVTMWQKTRQAHGEPVAAAPPAPVQPPATPPAQPANGNPMAGARTTSWAGGQAGGAVAHGTGGSYLGGAAPAPPAQPKPAAPSGPPPIANVIAAAASAETRGAAIQAVAKTVNVDSALLEALMTQESSGSNKAVSKDGALGFGQLMPGTASDLGVDPRDPVQNMAGSAVYLRQMLDRFKTIPRALAAYNQGPDAVVQARNGIPQAAVPYVQSVMARYLARRRQEERVEAMGGQQRGNI